jgi:hypothetical protein
MDKKEILAEIERLEESLKLVRGTPCEVWCRVTGFFRPVSAFNPGKKSEFDERVNFIVDK